MSDPSSTTFFFRPSGITNKAARTEPLAAPHASLIRNGAPAPSLQWYSDHHGDAPWTSHVLMQGFHLTTDQYTTVNTFITDALSVNKTYETRGNTKAAHEAHWAILKAVYESFPFLLKPWAYVARSFDPPEWWVFKAIAGWIAHQALQLRVAGGATPRKKRFMANPASPKKGPATRIPLEDVIVKLDMREFGIFGRPYLLLPLRRLSSVQAREEDAMAPRVTPASLRFVRLVEAIEAVTDRFFAVSARDEDGDVMAVAGDDDLQTAVLVLMKPGLKQLCFHVANLEMFGDDEVEDEQELKEVTPPRTFAWEEFQQSVDQDDDGAVDEGITESIEGTGNTGKDNSRKRKASGQSKSHAQPQHGHWEKRLRQKSVSTSREIST